MFAPKRAHRAMWNLLDVVQSFQIRIGRAVDYLAMRIKSRAVAGAVPGLFAGVPMHDAADVGADGGTFVNGSRFVFKYSDLRQPLSSARPGRAGSRRLSLSQSSRHSGKSAVAIHTDTVVPESLFISLL